jgi:hypothetical protein
MKPPIFVWNSGVLDVFDSADELVDRFSIEMELVEGLEIFDCSGQILKINKESVGAVKLISDKSLPPKPNTLSSKLRTFLEHGGISAEVTQSMSLVELIQKVYPVDEQSIQAHQMNTKSRSRFSAPQASDSASILKPLGRAYGLSVAVGTLTAFFVSFISVLSHPLFSSVAIFSVSIAFAIFSGVGTFLVEILPNIKIRLENGERVVGYFIGLILALLAVGMFLGLVFSFFSALGRGI